MISNRVLDFQKVYLSSVVKRIASPRFQGLRPRGKDHPIQRTESILVYENDTNFNAEFKTEKYVFKIRYKEDMLCNINIIFYIILYLKCAP